MRAIIGAFAVLSLVGLSGAADGAQSPSDADARALTSIVERWTEARNANDAEAMRPLFADTVDRVRLPLGTVESTTRDELITFFADGFRGPASLLVEPELWPRTVIVMTLAQVGPAAGPDLARLKEVLAKAGNREVVAAGGVRGEADLRALADLGVSAALVATSLHDGTLDRDALARLAPDAADARSSPHQS